MDALMTRVTLACQSFEVTADEAALLMRAAMGAGTHDRLPMLVAGLLDEIELRPVVVQRVDAAMVASAGMDPHFYCDTDVYCRNPLHPGPCKGWTRQLGTDPASRRDVAPVDKDVSRIRPVPGNRPLATPEDERREQRRIAMANRRAARRAFVQAAVTGLIGFSPAPTPRSSSGGRASSRSTSGSSRPSVAVNSQRVQQHQATVAAAVQATRANPPTPTGGGGAELKAAFDELRDINASRIAAGRSQNRTRELDARQAAAEAQVKAAAERIWGLDDTANSGLKSEVTSVNIGRRQSDGSFTVSVGVRIAGSGNRLGGTSSRTLTVHQDGEIGVYHAYLQLDRSTQGGGFATRYNGQAFDQYEAAGVKSVKVSANLDVGGYTWATQGFDFASQHSMDRMASVFRQRRARYAGQSPVLAEIDALLARSTPDNWRAGTHPTPYEWSQVGATCCARTTNGRRTWPGKSAMLGTSWDGAKPITGNLRSRPQGVPAGGVREPAAVTAAAAIVKDFDVEWGDGEGWTERASFLEDVWQDARAYGDTVGDFVPACEDAEGQSSGDEPTNVPEFHHLMCAPTALDEVFVEMADDLLDAQGRAPGDES